MTHTIHPFGERGLLITLPETISPTAISNFLAAEFGFTARVGLNTVLVLSETLPSSEALSEAIERAPKEASAVTSRQITIPVHYAGEDLQQISEALNMSTDEVIAAHQETTWRVALVGFAPGFPYLVPVEENSPFIGIPRLATPRSAVPAGSVALAAGMSAVYPNTMPGGWMLLGHTDIPLFEPQSAEPSLLTAGDIVKFVEVRS